MKINKLFIAGLAALTLTACSLDVDDVTEMSTANFPASEDDATAVLAGIYYNLNAINAYPQESFLYAAMLASDDQLGGGGANDKLMQAWDFITNNGTDASVDFFTDRYSGINRANTLIKALPGLDFDEDSKAQYMGEALFLRAFYYYELASFYGNVPLLTEPSGEYTEAGEISVLWGQILQDLYTAATTMPATCNQNNGHVDKYVAEAMLGRAWLFYTGMYGNGESLADLTSTTYNPLTSVELPDGTTLTKAMVIDLIDDCVNNSGYSLVADYRELWPYTNKYSVEYWDYTAGQGLSWCQDDEDGTTNAKDTEIMFATKFNQMASWSTTIGYGNGYALHFATRGGMDYSATFPFGTGWGAGPIAANLVTDWKNNEPADMRRDASIVDFRNFENYEWGGASWADYCQETGYFCTKIMAIIGSTDGTTFSELAGTCDIFTVLMYGYPSLNDSFQTNNWQDLIHIRFADVLLMQSELKEDATGMNKVRARAGLSAVSYSLSALQNERRWEFSGEGTRWNDIRRWHIAATALAKQEGTQIFTAGVEGTNTAHNGGYAARYNATAGFFKIPESQVSLGYIEQNEGWTDATAEYQGW